jgi:hypothetical protein
MDRADLLARLEEARRHADRGDVLIEAQRRLIACLAAAGSDTAAARNTLDALEQTHALQLSRIDRLLDALDTLPLTEKR